jgi:membrane protein implicated in regulation of membrane protease activity
MEALKSFFTPEVLWFAAGVILLIMEFAAPGIFIMFFGAGAMITGLVCLIFDLSLTVQLIIFISSSLILLFALRKWLKKVFFGKKTEGDELDDVTDTFIGERAVVTDKITKAVTGRIELHGTEWTAEADEDISKGTTVEVIGKKNLVLKVKPLS